MARTDKNGRERVEIKLRTETRKKAEVKAKALKTKPPTSPKKFIEDIVEKHLNPKP